MDASLALFNLTRGSTLAQKVYVACGFFQKAAGLLTRSPLEAGEALLIPSICPQVHTFFMGYAIDLVFLNSQNNVVGLETLNPWRLSRIYWRANKVVELTAGVTAKSATEMGDKMEFRD